MARYTLNDFEKEFPDEATCLDKVFVLRYGSLDICCPDCGNRTHFRRVPTRKSYQCRLCYHQIYPCAGTPFEKTRTPLTYWFYVMYLMTTTRNGVSSMEVQRILGVTYKTAYLMTTQIRKLMGMRTTTGKAKKYVELDETYWGGKQKNAKERTVAPKKAVFGIVERMGDVHAEVLPTNAPTGEHVVGIIKKTVDPQAYISTDDSNLYKGLVKEGFSNHGVVVHSLHQYRKGDTSTNTIEGFFNQLKRMASTHIHIEKLDLYLGEACFRYNHRHKDVDMFGTLVGKITDYRE